jgi:hypothetical protein
MKTISILRAVLTIALILIGFSTSHKTSSAQSRFVNWTDYENISNTPTASTYPTMVADRAGNVHVLWTEDVDGATENRIRNSDGSPRLDFRGKQVNYLTDSGNTLYYTRWDGIHWLLPVDIQTILDGSIFFPSAAVDSNGILHVIWAEGNTSDMKLLYSQAPVSEAMNARAWSVPILLADSILTYYYPSALVVDTSGGLHVVYYQFGSAPGVYAINSFDSGQNWSIPVLLYANLDEAGVQDGSLPVRITIDAMDRLHATWTRYDSTGNGKAIYYSQSSDLGRTWTNPFLVSRWEPGQYEVDWLSVGVVGDTVYLNWEGSASTALINERISFDGGETWTDEKNIIPKLVGENGWADLVVDSDNNLYQIITKRISIGGVITFCVWFIPLDGDHWSTPQVIGNRNFDVYSSSDLLDEANVPGLFHNTIMGDGLRYQRSVIVNGNELFVVVVNEYDGEIYASRALLNASAIPPQPFPTLVVSEGETNLISPDTTQTNQVTETEDLKSGGQPIRPGSLFFISIVPAVLLVFAVIIFRNNFNKGKF